MSERRINEYIEGKYGKLGVDRYPPNSCLVTASFAPLYIFPYFTDQWKDKKKQWSIYIQTLICFLLTHLALAWNVALDSMYKFSLTDCIE